MECAGQTMQVIEQTMLFSLIETKYGGNSITNFCLPNISSVGQQYSKAKYFISMEVKDPKN
jgi:microcystin-dependent protein